MFTSGSGKVQSVSPVFLSLSFPLFPTQTRRYFTLSGLECVLGGRSCYTLIMCTYMEFYLVCLAYKHASAVGGDLPGLFAHLLLLSPLHLLLPASRITLSLKRFL